MTVIYKGSLPEVFGYGFESYADDPDTALLLLRQMWDAWTEDIGGLVEHLDTFNKTWEYFGGYVEKITTPCSGTENECGETLDAEEVKI